MEIAHQLAAEGASEGTLVWAARQERGRGRLGRVWESPEGGAYFSLILRPSRPPREIPQLSLIAGLAGGLYAFSKVSISPEALAVPRSVDGLVMVLLGGVHTLIGPLWGAALFTWLQDSVARGFDYWRAVIGAVVLLFLISLLRRA